MRKEVDMPKKTPTDEQIREAAYHLWMADGAPDGRDQDYWFEAEKRLTAPKKAPAKKAPAKKTATKAAAAKKPAAKKAPAKKTKAAPK